MDKRFTKLKTLIGLIGLIGLMLGNAMGLIGQQLRNTNLEINGTIYAYAEDGEFTYMGGDQQLISTDGSPFYNNNNGVFFDSNRGMLSTSFPDFGISNGGSNYNAISDSNGGWYVAGQFSDVNDDNTFAKLVHVLSDGTLDSNFKPSFNNGVNQVVLDGSHLYVVGPFTEVNGVTTHPYAVRLNTSDGSIDTSWNPVPSRTVESIAVTATEIVLTGGSGITFNNGSVNIGRIVKTNKTDGTVDDTSWKPFTASNNVQILVEGDDLYLAGGFPRSIDNPFAPLQIGYLARYSMSTGDRDETFDLGLDDDVNDMVIADGYLYAVGIFTQVEGQAVNGAVKINLSNDNVVSSWNPGAISSGQINEIAISGNDAYIGGTFTKWNGKNVGQIVKINAANGNRDTDWKAHVSEGRVTDITISGAKVFVGGNFRAAGGNYLTNQIFRINTISGEYDPSWGVEAIGNDVPGDISNGIIRTLAFDDNYVYASGYIGNVDVKSHNVVARFSKSDGSFDQTWNPDILVANNGSVNGGYTMIIDGNDLYLGGLFQSVGGTTWPHLAKINIATGALDTSWNPAPSERIFDLVLEGNHFFVAGSFTSIGGETINGLARIDKITGAADPSFNLITSGLPLNLASDGNAVYVVGAFQANTPVGSRRSALKVNLDGSVDTSWNPAPSTTQRFISIDGEDIYIGNLNVDGITTWGGTTTTRGIAKLNNTDGSLDPGWNRDIEYPNSFFAKDGQVFVSSNADMTFNGQNIGQYAVFACATCGFQNIELCGDFSIDSSGELYLGNGAYLDTIPSTTSGVDSVVFVTVNSEVNKTYTQDNITDETLELNVENLSHTAITNYAARAVFTAADEDWVNINNVAPSLAAQNRSVFMWIRKETQVDGDPQMLFSIQTSGGNWVQNISIRPNEELAVYDGYNSIVSQGTTRSSNVVVTDGQWHHVGYTYNNSTNETIIYVDGVNTNTFSNNQESATDSQFSLGQQFNRNTSTANDFYDGEMTEVTLWNEVLSESEVALLMQQRVENTHPKYNNLVAYYPMLNDCGQNTGGTEIYDYTGNNLHGTATANDLIDTQNLGTIPNFNGAGWFNCYWVGPQGNTLSSTSSVNESSFQSGTYQQVFVNRHFAITDGWVVTRTGNTNPTIAEAILDRTALYAQADSTFSIAANFTDAESSTGLTFTVQNNTDNTVVTATVNGNEITLDFGLVGSSELTIRATDPDGGFVDDTFTVTVNKATPTLSFTPVKSIGINTGDVASQLVLVATSNADGTNTNPITFELVSGPATFDGGTNTLTFGQTHGTVQVRANQAESDYYLAATKTENITVRRPRIITSDVEFFDFESGDYGSKSFTVSGEDLIGDVTIQAPANLEISADNITFGPQVILTKVVGGNDLLNEPVTLTTRFVANPTPPFFDSYFIDYSTDQAQTTTSEVEVMICQSATDICATATTVNSEKILVRWIDKAGSGAESYQIERATEDVEASYQLIHTEPANGGVSYSFTDTELTPGTTYFYRVRWVKN